MLNLIEDDNFLKDEHKYFINNIILSSHFPYYLNTNAVGNDGNKFVSHTILRRPEERANDEQIFRSPYADHAIEIFKTFIIKNKIDTEELLRCAINLCFKTKSKDCTIHTDHEYDHKQLIIYLNDPIDKTAKTILLDPSKKKILHKLTPKQYKGVCFDSCPHYFNFPKKDIRVVLVYTFR